MVGEVQTFYPQHYVVGYGVNSRDAIDKFVASCGDLGITVYTAEEIKNDGQY